jgi:hypothetical protein
MIQLLRLARFDQLQLTLKLGRHRLKSNPLCLAGHRGCKAFSAFDLAAQVVGSVMGTGPLIPQAGLPQTLAIRPPFVVACRALPGSASGAPCASSVRRIRHGANVSSTIRALSSCDQRRRRSNPPKTSTRIA